MSKSVKEKKVPATKPRTTINLPEQAHIQLSRMTLKIRAKGVSMFKQELAARMISHFNKNPKLLADLVA